MQLQCMLAGQRWNIYQSAIFLEDTALTHTEKLDKPTVHDFATGEIPSLTDKEVEIQRSL